MSDYIPEEQLRQILKSLPVKSLLRFRCVCKGWKQLIDSPSFSQEHISLQNPTLLIQSTEKYFMADPNPLPSIKRLNSPINLPDYSLMGTHHGVVCLTDYPGPNIILWNPILRKFSTPIQVPYIVGYRAHSRSKGCYGFWIDPSTKEFKILVHHCFFGQADPSVCALIYSSIRHDWRFISQPELSDWVSIISEPPLMVNGVAHWTGFHKKLCADGVILSFDFVAERFEHILMPPAPRMNSIMQFIWRGNLSVLQTNEDGSRYEMHARQQGEWVKISAFNLRLPPTKQFRKDVHIFFWLLVEQERLWTLRKKAETGLVLLDINTCNTTLLVDELSNALVLRDTRVANDFVQSLLFP